MTITKKELNLRYLAFLDSINPKLRHTSTGSKYRHPTLRLVLLRAIKEDIVFDGLESTIEKYKSLLQLNSAQAYRPD